MMEGASFPLQILIALLAFVSTSLLAVLVFFGKRFINSQDGILEDQGKILVVIGQQGEQIKTLFSTSERHERTISALENHHRESHLLGRKR